MKRIRIHRLRTNDDPRRCCRKVKVEDLAIATTQSKLFECGWHQHRSQEERLAGDDGEAGVEGNLVSGEDETGGFGRPGLAIVGGGVDAVAGVDSGGGGVDGVGGVVEAEVEGGSVEGALPGRLVEYVGGDPDAAVGVVVEAAADGSEDVAVGELEDVLDGVVGREAGHLPGDAGVGRDGEASEVAGVSDVPLEAHLRGGRSTTGSVDGVRVCGGDVEGGDGAAGDGLRVEDVDPERAFAGDGISGSPNTTVDSAEEEGVTNFNNVIGSA